MQYNANSRKTLGLLTGSRFNISLFWGEDFMKIFTLVFLMFSASAFANNLEPWRTLEGGYIAREINGRPAHCEEVSTMPNSLCGSDVTEGYSYGIGDENRNAIPGIIFRLLEGYGTNSSTHIFLPIPEKLGETEISENHLNYKFQGRLSFPCTTGSVEVKVEVDVTFLNPEKTLFRYDASMNGVNDPNDDACYNAKFSTVLEKLH